MRKFEKQKKVVSNGDKLERDTGGIVHRQHYNNPNDSENIRSATENITTIQEAVKISDGQ